MLSNNLSEKLCFTSADFDRQALNRSDKEWVANQFNDNKSLFLLFWDNKFLTENDLSIKFVERLIAEQLNSKKLCWSYMGQLEEPSDEASVQASAQPSLLPSLHISKKVNTRAVFAAEISYPTAECLEANWSSLRTLGLLITSEVANLLAYTQGLLNWQSNNNFCSVCASKLEIKQAGHALICTNMECTKEIFPRTDPAVIVLIYNQDACLLGRAAAWPENMYSCLAGFVETGENLDAAIRREVFEESGLQLKNISYRASQPWPFPQSLMFGFHAESLSRELTFHDGEIQDARWF
ncbi:MAG: NADH pyrophosphatase NudC (nudix superfamily), partial [Limisphaerales bacterium]